MPEPSQRRAIIVHGGAWDIPEQLHGEHLAGCRAAAAAGWDRLAGGGTAIQAVEAAIRVMEDQPVFDAGRGSHFNADGQVELDAGMMDGATGGTFYKSPGRVGDTAIIGCGLYADNTMGAAACTGVGEQIMKTVLAKTTVDQIALLRSAKDAARVAIAYFEHRVAGQGGVICVSPDGQIGFAHTTPYLAHAYRNAEVSVDG